MIDDPVIHRLKHKGAPESLKLLLKIYSKRLKAFEDQKKKEAKEPMSSRFNSPLKMNKINMDDEDV